jgi:hypothetical protein
VTAAGTSGSVQALLQALNGAWLEHMREGRFDEAWKLSDAAHALRVGVDCTGWPRHQQFIWSGENVDGKRVLVRCYHGLGDTIQFVRFVSPLRRLASHVTLWVQPKLIPLLATTDGVDAVLPLHDGAPEAEYDLDVELSELMHVLRIGASTIPARVPYLHVDQAPVRRARCGPLRVGLVWASGEWDGARSIPCELLSPLRHVAGVEWVLFQRGPALARWPHSFGVVPDVMDMASEARAMLGLDLLISVDTCSAHLAGALGVPVWTLLRKEADWRWMRDREDTPWYPTMRLLRQKTEGNWKPLIDQVVGELRTSASWASKRIASR